MAAARATALKSSVAALAAPVSARGDATLTLGDRVVRLRFTLGAMDRIETTFGLESIDEIETVLQRPSARKIAKIIVALAEGAGEKITEDDVINGGLTIEEAAAAIVSVMQAGSQDHAGNAKAPDASA